MAFTLDNANIKPKSFKLRNKNSASSTNNTESDIKQEKVICEISRFIHRNKETGFFVFVAKLPEKDANLRININGQTFVTRTFNVVGTSILAVENYNEKQEIECYGYFEIGKTDQLQFKSDNLREIIPTKPKAIEAFLSSNKIPGIGPKTAKKIVAKYGADTLHVLDNNMDALIELDGITPIKLEKMKKAWKDYRATYELLSTMKLYGITDASGLKIYNHFKEKTLDIIKNDPYKITDVQSIGFKTADKIAQSVGISHVDPVRIKYAIFHTLQLLAETEGQTAYGYYPLIDKVNELLDIDKELVEEQIENAITKGELISKEVTVKINDKNESYLQQIKGVAHKLIHNTEVRIAREIHRINMEYKKQDIRKIDQFIEVNEFGLDESQLKAASKLLRSKLSVLTGGPGTGKTHTIKSIINFYKKNGKKCVLCAPTGRAAKRMEESTGETSSTIHRLLKYVEGKFTHDENNKLEGDIFIIDESSMIDIWLANGLLKAIPDDARVLFVGDIDQLPSVGAGNFLKDIINSGVIAVARLTQIHRQAQNSNIIKAAHSIIHGHMPELFDKESDSDFVFIEAEGQENIHAAVTGLVNELLGKNKFAKNMIQLLTPKKDTLVGTDNFNESLRELLNMVSNEPTEEKFTVGDRVMQYKNNYELDVYNGDLGYIADLDTEDKMLSVYFENKEVAMSYQEANDLKLAYAITVHKSQGSDYPCVIIPVSKSHTFMWDANLLYTAVTRGKAQVYLIGEKKTLFYCTANFRQNYRITGLEKEIKDYFREKEEEAMDVLPKNLFEAL
jgi:exodeoxyribonuclease V alpha subunit